MLKKTFMDRVFKDAYYVLKSGYGYRIHPITHVRKFHYGEDYGTGGKKVPLYSPVYGVVKESTYNVIRGNYITITTREGLVRMQHLDSRSVKVGQRVQPGTKVGVCGTTGSSTGIHLHIEYKTLTGAKLDPADFIPSYTDPILARKKTSTNLNVRVGPGTKFALANRTPNPIPKGTLVKVFAYKLDGNGKKWARIDYVDTEWVANWFLV